MSDVLINDNVTFGFPHQTEYEFRNSIVESFDGVQQVIQHRDHDRLRVTANFSVMNTTDKNSLVDFFAARKGAYDTFLYKDYRKFDVVSEVIGTGDGSTLTYQLTEDGFDRWNIAAGTLTLWTGVTEQVGGGTDYSVTMTDSGQIVYTSAPVSDAAITASYQYHRRMRFVSDFLAIREDSYLVFGSDSLIFEEVIITP